MTRIIKRTSARRGFTLTEIAIVLGVIGAITAGIWMVAGAAYQNQKVEKAQQQIMKIAHTVRSMYMTHGTIAAADYTGNFISMGNIFPSDMVVGTTTVNPWGTVSNEPNESKGNGVTVESATNSWACGGAGTSGFTIVYWQIPSSACAGILMSLAGPAALANGINCIYSDGFNSAPTPGGITDITGLSNGTYDSEIQNYCSGNVAIGFNIRG